MLSQTQRTMATEPIESEKQTATEGSPQISSTMVTMSGPGATKDGNTEARIPVTEEYPHGARLAAIVISLMLGMFLVALDNVSYTFGDTQQS